MLLAPPYEVTHPDSGTKIAMIKVLHGIVAEGGWLEVRECRRIDLGLELHEAHLDPAPG